MKQGVYGIESFKMMAAVPNGFPTNWTGAQAINAIVKDSLTFNDSEASENDIEVEDMTDFYASLPSTLATKGFTVQTYDLSPEMYQYLCGYSEQGGYYVENPNFQLGNQAVQIVTKKFGEFPSKTFEWANMMCKVTRSGTIGKSGFPNFNITFKQQSLTDSSGNPIGGARFKMTDSTVSGE